MNLILLRAGELASGLPRSDRRVDHILTVLKKKPGDEILAGSEDGMIGTASIESFDGRTMRFSFVGERSADPLYPLVLILGFPRPIQAKRILKDLCSLGVGRIVLCGTELGEKSYVQSDVYKNKDFLHALIEGAEQAGNPRLPAIETAWTLDRALASLGTCYPSRLAFDPRRATVELGSLRLSGEAAVLAIGSERGWTENELRTLRERGFTIASLGKRILKTETAAVSAVSIVLGKLGKI